MRQGLAIRAKAMIDCSWAWGQIGRQILRSLDDLGSVEVNGSLYFKVHVSVPYTLIGSLLRDGRPGPEADSARPSSDFSSIGPSQSASQVGHQLKEPINLMKVITNTDSGVGQPANDRELMKPVGVENQQQESESEPEQEKEKKENSSFLHQPHKRAGTSAFTQGQGQSQSDIGHATFALPIITSTVAPSTPKASPLKLGTNLPDSSPSTTSPSKKRFLGSLRGLFGARQPVSPQIPSQVQDSSPLPPNFGNRTQDPSASRFRGRSTSRIRTADSDIDSEADSDVESLTKTGGLQALFRGTGAKKKNGSVRWSTRTDKNLRKLTRTGDGDDDHDDDHDNVVVKTGPDGGISADPGGVRKRSASDIGTRPAVARESTSPKVVTGGGKRLKKAPPPAVAPALHISPSQRTNGVAVHAHTPTTSTPVRKSSVNANIKNPSIGTPARGIPAAGTLSKGYSSDTAVVSSSLKKNVTRNTGPGPAPTVTPAATVTSSRPIPTRKPSTGKTQTHTTPNMPVSPINTKAGGQSQLHHQQPTSHFASSSGGGAVVLAAGGTHPSGTLISQPGWDAQALPTPGGGLSRNNSIVSVVSTPAGGSGSGASGMSKTKKQKQTVLGHGMGSGTSLGRRSSLGSSSGHGGERRAGGSVVQPTQPAQSLMSIVEDVAKHNREWSQKSSQLFQNKHKNGLAGLEKEKRGSVGMVAVVKAPPRVGRDELAQLEPAAIKSWVMETSTMNLAPSSAVTSASGVRLIDVKAPGSVFDQRNAIHVGLVPATQRHVNSTPGLTQSQQAYQSNLTRRASATAVSTATAASGTKRPAKSPLRSALKSQSRTPSPLPGPFLVPDLQKQQQHLQQQVVPRNSTKSDTTLLGPTVSKPPTKASAAADIRPTLANGRPVSYDSASQRGKTKTKSTVSEVVGESGDAEDSTSTGNEIFYTDDEGDHSEAAVVSPHGVAPMLNGHAVGYTESSELSHSSTSTAVVRHHSLTSASQPTTPPRRRKSVRVSLQPTFSPSPPAIEDDDEEPWVWKQDHSTESGQYVHAPIPRAAPSLLLNPSHRQKVVMPEPYDIWEDSSEEDVEYKKAKQSLATAARKERDMKVIVVGGRS